MGKKQEQAGPLDWATFQQVDIRVGTILEAQVFEKAIKPAYLMKIDFGPLGIKKSSAQLTQLYEVEELPGRQVLAVVNFPPKQIANIRSECLVLGCVGEKNAVVLIQPERAVPNGWRVA